MHRLNQSQAAAPISLAHGRFRKQFVDRQAGTPPGKSTKQGNLVPCDETKWLPALESIPHLSAMLIGQRKGIRLAVQSTLQNICLRKGV